MKFSTAAIFFLFSGVMASAAREDRDEALVRRGEMLIARGERLIARVKNSKDVVVRAKPWPKSSKSKKGKISLAALELAPRAKFAIECRGGLTADAKCTNNSKSDGCRCDSWGTYLCSDLTLRDQCSKCGCDPQ